MLAYFSFNFAWVFICIVLSFSGVIFAVCSMMTLFFVVPFLFNVIFVVWVSNMFGPEGRFLVMVVLFSETSSVALLQTWSSLRLTESPKSTWRVLLNHLWYCLWSMARLSNSLAKARFMVSLWALSMCLIISSLFDISKLHSSHRTNPFLGYKVVILNAFKSLG